MDIFAICFCYIWEYFFFLREKKKRIRMDLSHLAILQYKQDKHSMEMIFLKKKKTGKGFFLIKNNGKIEDIQSLYPTQAGKLLFAKIKELKHFKFVDGDKWKVVDNGRNSSSLILWMMIQTRTHRTPS